MRILLTGSSGLLGTEIRKLDSDLLCPDESEMDIRDYELVLKTIQEHKPDVILHLAALTNPPAHDENPESGIEINIIGTANVARAAVKHGVKLVYTSSDYVYAGAGPHKEDEPVLPNRNFYWSKMGGECAVQMVPQHLVLRLSFGPRPFPYEKVYRDQWCSKLYIDEMAPLVLLAAKSTATGVLNIGGPRVLLEEYAKRSRPDIETVERPLIVPADVSLDITRMQKELNIDNQ